MSPIKYALLPIVHVELLYHEHEKPALKNVPSQQVYRRPSLFSIKDRHEGLLATKLRQHIPVSRFGRPVVRALDPARGSSSAYVRDRGNPKAEVKSRETDRSTVTSAG